MNNKTKGALQILLVVVLIAAFAYVAVRFGSEGWRKCHLSGK